jgi:hypothetical protein
MARPVNPLITDMVDGTRHFWSLSDLTFSDHSGAQVTIKAGFLSDGLSIPKVFQSIFSKSPYYIFAGIIHDFGYRRDFPHKMSRKNVDRLFLYYMKKYGVGFLARHTIYRAVRLGAFKNWKARNSTYHD